MNRGIIFGISSAALFTIYALINRHVFNTYDVDAFSYVVTFSLANGACGLTAIALKREKKKFLSPNFWEVIMVSLMGIIAISIFVFAQSKTTATNASVLASIVILTTAGWSIPVLKQKPTKNMYIWIPVMLSGIYLVLSGFSSLSINSGDMLIILSIVIFGLNNAYVKKLVPEFGGEFMANFRMPLGAAILLTTALILNRDEGVLITSAGLWPIIAGVASYFNILFTFKAMNYISATNALVLNMSHVVLTMVSAAVFLNEETSILKLLSGLIVFYSVYRLVRVEGKPTKSKRSSV